MIEFYKVTKSYDGGGVRAVDELTLTIEPGEIFGFLGPNGAGKTTTMKMLVGLLMQDDGAITVNGIDTLKEPLAAKKMIGYVPDQPEVYEKLTGLEYLNFIADVFGVPPDVRARTITRFLEQFELGAAAGDRIQSYSHGMRQKLLLTAALLHDPEVLVLDEPMVGLDPRASHLLKEIMREHCARGGTLFFSTHVLEVAEKLCDRIGIINHGKLIACGTMEELRGHGQSLESIFLELTEE
ncbi:MAG TPA: ABC transporter ATP-binding protein [Spirochaetia bacterium]|nr:ABC transporter ATP-binding protein [Spirochaetia bacterium]